MNRQISRPTSQRLALRALNIRGRSDEKTYCSTAGNLFDDICVRGAFRQQCGQRERRGIRRTESGW